MRKLKYTINLLLISIICCAQYGCTNFRKSSKRNASGSGFIDRNSVTITRTQTRSSAVVEFKTTNDSLCSISFWPQNGDASKATDSNCSSPTAQTAHSQIIKNLPKEDQTFRIRAWTPDNLKQEELVINEADVKGDDQITADSLVIARLDVPLRTAELHINNPDKALSAEELKNRLTPSPGCQKQPLNTMGDLSAATGNISLLQGISTRGFGAATAKQHPNFSDRLRLYYNILQFSDRWEWFFDLNESSQSFAVRSAAQLLTAELNYDGNAFPLDAPKLLESETPISMTGKELKARWTTSNLPDIAYIGIQIGKTGQKNTFSCIFPASSGEGSIAKELVDQLTKDTYVVLLSLESAQIQTPKDNGPLWLLSASDWRSTRIIKQ